MASSDPEIKDGFTLPIWMKTKATKDFEQFARSPPAPEDFYIRYPKTDMLFGKGRAEQEFTKTLTEKSNELTAAVSFNVVKEKDWSKHTKSCQDVLHGITPINTIVNSATVIPKPAGTDDGFKGEGAACGNSVVKVAHEMISMTGPNQFGPSGLGERGERGERGECGERAERDAEGPGAGWARARMSRRGSRSLPASPAHTPPGSPTSRRKHTNRYFTSPFEPVEDGSNRSWLTMALLGFKKDLTTSTSTLAEEDVIENRLQNLSTFAESVESLGPGPRARAAPPPAPSAPTAPAAPAPRPHTFRPKPSELREMNFWSPTSM